MDDPQRLGRGLKATELWAHLRAPFGFAQGRL